MATSYLQEHDQFFNELMNDDDSDGDFEGFDDEDLLNDEDLPEIDDFMKKWTDGDRVPHPFEFPGTPGVKQTTNLDESSSVTDIFGTFITENDFEVMAEETNRYANQFLDSNCETIKPNSRFRKWVATTASEMKLFIAMLIAMGVVVQLDLSEYWTSSDVNETPFFKKCMPRDRFWLLMSFFHLVDNRNHIRRGLPGFDPLFKLGTLYKNIIKRFATSYHPHRELSLDEGMVPWRGNLSFRVYNPDKPKKYGIKAYMICDAQNGYCTKFKLYTGKSDVPASEFGATYDLVMDLMRNYMYQGYILYMDNYYSSPKLYRDLWTLGVGASGTLRQNRKGVPQRIKEINVPKGDIFTMHNDNLMISKYHDRKMVFLLSTVDTAEKINTGKNNPVTRQPIQKPQVVVNYDKFMGGVDRSDQMVSYATFNARTLKWWKRVIFHVISLAVLNSYLIYKNLTRDSVPMLHRVFRKKLVEEIFKSIDPNLVPGMSGRPRGRPSTFADPIQRLQGKHFPEKILGTGKKKNLSRACVVCAPVEREIIERSGEKRKRCGRESSYKCDTCGVALCVVPCFKLYHSVKDFSAAYRAHRESEKEN